MPLVAPPVVQVYERRQNGWRSVGRMTAATAPNLASTIEAVLAGQVQKRKPRWPDLEIAGRTYHLARDPYRAEATD